MCAVPIPPVKEGFLCHKRYIRAHYSDSMYLCWFLPCAIVSIAFVDSAMHIEMSNL